MSGDLLDLILIALAAAFAVAGYRQGFVVGVMSFVGFLGGAAIGAVIGPGLARLLVKGASQQAVIGIVAVFLAAVIGQLLASVAGAALRSHLTWRPVALLDSVGGAGVSVVSVLLIAWFIGSAVAGAPFPSVATQVNKSMVLRGVDRFMPPAAQTMFSDFRRLLASGPYTQVFGSLGVEGAPNVRPPDSRVLNSPGLARDSRSIVKIMGFAQSCQRELEGSGFVISPHHVLTNAHVVAGVDKGPVVWNHQRGPFSAKVVLYNPSQDVAVLYVPGLQAPSLRFSFSASRGSDAIVAGYPENQGFRAVPARVGNKSLATGPDIYKRADVTRQIYSIRAQVLPGNSGGPLLAAGGRVYGVVFAAAVTVRDTGYALTAHEVQGYARRGASATIPVSTQGCD